MLNEKLHKIYESAQADALLIECEFLRKYLTGFSSTDGFAVLDKKDCTLVVDARYLEAAQKALRGGTVKVVEGGRAKALELVADRKTLGVPYPFLSAQSLEQLRAEGHETVDCMPALREAMLVKTEKELSCIARASEIAEEAFSLLLPEIREGMTETEVAAILEYLMRMLGASGTSFDTICAFGENGSIPHYETGARQLRFGDPVLIDFGCKVEGYCSDITRTFLFGDDGQHEEFKKLHGVVLMAHELAKEGIRAGMTGAEADAIARRYLTVKGYGDLFTHSLGHGVGLRIHEAPTLSPRGEEVLRDGMVFSVEPGIYLPGRLGIRIEDTVTLKDGKVVSFMNRTSRRALIL